MEIKIYSQSGTLKATVSPGSGGRCVKELQGDSVLNLSFDYFEYVALDVNDYVDFCGDRYWLLEQYRPKEVSSVEWKYDVSFYGIESLIKRYLVIEHTDGDANPVFTLTAPASQHMQMIVECLNNATGTQEWHVGTVVSTGNITVDYTGKYCDEGLRELAEKTGVEYWFSGNNGKTVNLSKCERGDLLEMSYGDGLISLERDVADNAKFYTRLYPVGSARNIGSDYGFKRLQLPEVNGVRPKYVDLEVEKYGVVDHYEQDAFSDIYPKYTGTVSSVRVETRTDEDGEEFQVYFFRDSGLPFDPNDHLLPDESMRVSFQSGDLQGLGESDDHYFEVNYDSETGEFEIINIWTDGQQLPGGNLVPAVGDTYIPWNISMPESYYLEAEQALKTAVDDYNSSHFADNSLYRGTTDHVWIEADPDNDRDEVELYIGRRIRLISTEYFPVDGYRDSRITKISRRIDLPSQMDLEISDAVSTGTLTKINDEFNYVREYARGLEAGFSDSAFLNLLTRYGSMMFLSKTHGDTAQGLIRFIKGFQVGERFVTGLLGEGGVFNKDADGKTYIEADKLYIRMKAYFDTVEIRKYMHSGGNRIASPAGAKCVRVENMAWYAAENKYVPVDEYGTYRKKDINDEEQVIATGLTIVRYRCYFRGEDNDGDKVTNDFVVGDQAYCHITNGATNALQMHHYWRLIVDRNTEGSLTDDGEFWIDLAATLSCTIGGVTYAGYQSGSDVPKAQDDIVQLGNVNDSTRRGAIIEFVSGNDAPSYQIFQDIGTPDGSTISEKQASQYSLEDKNYIGIGYKSSTGRAYMNVYGDAYIGDPDGSTFIKYEQEDSVTHRPKMTIRAEVEFQDPDDPTSVTTLEQFASTVITDIDNIQSQIDGELDTWYYAGLPTLNNLPASQWTTDDLKKMHVGDLYYDKNNGFVYRFIYDTSVTPNVYTWVQIHDDAISEALKQAEKAQDTADHKRRVFVTQPPSTSHPDGNYVEYDVGDLWANATGTFTYVEEGQTKTVTYNNDLLRCRVSKPIRNASGVVIDGTFSITDWELATRYTDDTKIDAFLDGYQGNLTAIRNQVDQKAETYYEDNDPSTSQWGSEHVGDMWFCTSDHADPSMFKKGTTWVWQEYTNQTTGVVTYAWAEAQIPQVVFDTLDRKKAVYVAWNAWITTDSFGVQHNNLQLRDLFIPSEDTTGGGVQYKANRVYRCVSLSPTTFQEIDYVDNQEWSNWIQNTYNRNISDIESQLDKKAETWYQNTDPSTTASPNGWYGEDDAEHVGDLWLVSIDVIGSNIYKAGTTWYFKDNGDGANPRYTWEKQVVPQEVFDYADGKAAIFVGNPPTTYNINDMWFIGDGVSSSQLPTGCIAGDVVVSSAKRTGVYNKADWAKKDRYTDDTKFNTYISQIINGTSDQSDSAVVAQALHAIKAALNENTTISGGLILTSLISLKSNSQVWAGISGLYDANETGGGIAAWYGGGRVDHEAYPSSSDYAKSLFRFDGSGYVAGGNITWNANGAVTIKNITTLSDSQNTNLLNELATFNSAFTFSTSGQGSTTVLSITPNVPFTALTILDTSVTPNVGRPVATQKWVADNYVSLAFFNALFTAYSDSAGTSVIDPKTWTAQTLIDNLKIMVGVWTNQYISAFGQNSSSGGGGSSTLAGLNDVSLSSPQAGQSLVYRNSHWVNEFITQGTVTSVGMSVPEGFSVSPSSINTTGTFVISFGGSVAKNKVLASPSNAAGAPSWRTLVSDDIPNLTASKITSGTFDAALVPNLSWSKITSDKPTSLVGYGITDAYTKTESEETFVMCRGYNKIIQSLASESNHYSLNSLTERGEFVIRNNANAAYFDDRPTTSKVAFRVEVRNNRSSDSYLTQRYQQSNSDRVYERYSDSSGSSWGDWKLVQRELSQTSITAWGQLYYTLSGGFANISGDMTGVGNITMSATNGTYIQIGDIRIVYDSTNNALKIVKSDGSTAANFYATGAVSAFGANSQSGGGGVGDVTWDLLASSSDTHQIALSHLTTALSSYPTQTAADNRYLKLTGGTITGIFGALSIKRDKNNYSAIKFVGSDDSRLGYIGVYNKGPLFSPDGSAVNLIWHQGNDGSGSGLDADLLDGIDSISFPKLGLDGATIFSSGDDLNNYTNIGTYYSKNTTMSSSLVNKPLSSNFKLIVLVAGNSNYISQLAFCRESWCLRGCNGTIWSSWRHLAFTDSDISGNAATATALAVSRTITLTGDVTGNFSFDGSQDVSFATTIGSGKVTNAMLANSSVTVNGTTIALGTSGTTTKWGAARNITIKDADSTNAGSAVSVDGSGAITLLLPSAIKASLTGNASTATQLQTARTLWGESFDGSANVKGDIYMLPAEAGIGHNADSARLKFNSGGVDSSTTVRRAPYIQAINVASYGRKRLSVFQSNSTSYTADFVEVLSILPTGNIGIGTTEPSYKLSVNGSINTTRLYLSSDVYLEYDSTNSGVHLVGAGLYVDTYVSAYGANTKSGGGIGDVTWSALGASVASTSQQIHESHLSSAFAACVRTTGAQTIMGLKTFSGGLSVYNSKFNANLGGKFQTLCIECDSSGSPEGRTGEINRYGGVVYLQYNSSYNVDLCHGGGSVKMQDTLTFSKNNTDHTINAPNKLTISGGQVYISASTFNGNAPYTGGSDIRKKNIVSHLGASIEQISNAPVFNFMWKDDATHTYVGTSAQYWQQIFPNAIVTGQDGYLSMDYAGTALAAAVITARKVLDHEGRIRLLEVENQALRQEIEQLKKAA